MDWSGIVSGIALIVAVLSPFFTAMITTRSEEKRQQIAFYNVHRAEVIEAYIRATGAVLKYADQASLLEYGRCYGEVLLYAPDDVRRDIVKLEDIRIGASSEATKLFMSICIALAENPPRSIDKSGGKKKKQ